MALRQRPAILQPLPVQMADNELAEEQVLDPAAVENLQEQGLLSDE